MFLENILHARPPTWLPKEFATYDDLLLDSADEAVTELEKATNNKDSNAWRWGLLHRLDMKHPLGTSGLLHKLLSIGPFESSGSVDTVRAMGIGWGPRPVPHGPAMRFVADLANFDDSLMEIATGESGQFASPYYRDQFPEWFAGRGIPAPFSEAEEDKSRAHRLYLLPSGAKPQTRQAP